MKQHITVEQLKEIPKEKYKLLFEKVGKKYYESNNIEIINGDMLSIAHKLTIGKMIEIIYNALPETDYIEDSIDIELDRATQMMFVEHRKYSNLSEYTEFKSKELCDALWEAVKETLGELAE